MLFLIRDEIMKWWSFIGLLTRYDDWFQVYEHKFDVRVYNKDGRVDNI